MHELIEPRRADVKALRSLIEDFLQHRLQVKLDKLGDGEDAKCQKLREEHQLERWMANAVHRVAWIQLATHTLKPIHPDARGTAVYLRESMCTERGLLGTHSLTDNRTDDVVGNAAALDVYQFLKLVYHGKSVLNRALENDPELIAALCDDADQARSWVAAFAGLMNDGSELATHTLAKQLYFPLRDGSYHLLAPLFPTALVHRLYETLQDHRYSDAAKEARSARRDDQPWPCGFREYPDLAVQKIGGSKPQNISLLNSERRGRNHLLPSLPPIWKSDPLKPPLQRNSVFEKHGAFDSRPQVQELTRTLRKFLARAGDYTNIRIRDTRAILVQEIVEELLDFAAQIRALPLGWSTTSQCRLDPIERRWLDPRAVVKIDALAAFTADSTAMALEAAPDWREEVTRRFANWLNSTISSNRTPMGDDEFSEWQKVLAAAQRDVREEITGEA